MSTIKELKQSLKQLSRKITEAKQELKKYQKENSGYDGGFFATIHKLSWEFRHKHIAYCLMRGTAYELIEKPAEDNKPDMALVQEVQNAYTANVCVGTPGPQ
jgi:hypothetical protein